MLVIDLAVAAKRYDGGSGSAVFSGVIPLKPSQLLEADLTKVTLWDGPQEVGLTASALWPQHPDGSMKVVQIAATLTLNEGVQKNLILRLGQARTVSGPAKPAINEAWMKNPRLIGSTDAAHLCASRVAPLPLVPIPHPNLPARWNTFLTTEWDSTTSKFPCWGKFREMVMSDRKDGNPPQLWGTAAYNMLSALYCKYLTSGELDRLNEAHHLAQYGVFPNSIISMTYGSHLSPAPFTNDGQLNGVVFNGDGTRYNANPDGWPDRTQNPITGTEWNSGVDTDLFMCYMLSGWEQAKGTFLCRALGNFTRRPWPDNPPTQFADNGLQSNLGTSTITDNIFKGNYGGRSQWRHWHGPDIFYYMLTAPGSMYLHRTNGKYATVPSPRVGRTDWLAWFKREHLDFFEKYSNRYVDGHWLKGSWWSTPGWFPEVRNSSGAIIVEQGVPFFQLKLLMYDVMLYLMNVANDPRIEPFIVAMAERMRASVHGPVPSGTNGNGYQLRYSAPNSYTNNATDGPPSSEGAGFWPTTTCLMIFTAAYRITGDLFYRDLADMHASNTMMSLADGTRAGFSTAKEFGETYFDAFHSAAFRAGVPVGAWEIDGVVEPPPPPPPDPDPDPEPQPQPGGIMATLQGNIQNEAQTHPEATYTGVRIRFQRSQDQGATWGDVQSNVRPLGTTADSYGVPVGAIGDYRMGAALTDGTSFGTEVFSNVVSLSLIQTPTTLVLTVVS